MDRDSRGLFRINLSREVRSSSSSSSSSSTSTSDSNNTSSSSSSLSRSSQGSSIQHVEDPSPPSTGIYEHADDANSSSTWGVQDMVSHVEEEDDETEKEQQQQQQEEQEKREKQQKQQQQQRGPPLYTPFDSPPLSLRGDSPSANASCHHSPPRVRPTSALPPTKSLGNVPHSSPTAMKPGEKICHDGMFSFESATPSQVSAQTPAFPSNISDPLVKSSFVSPYPSPIPKVTTSSTITTAAATAVPATIEVPEGGNLLHGAQCKVCSLCGVTVFQMGTLEEREKQYREHEESWVHQNNHEMRALLERGDASFSTRKGLHGDSLVSPTKQKLFDDLTTSPTLFSQKVKPLKGSSSLSGFYAQSLREETPTEEQKPMVSPPIIFQPVPHATEGTPSHVQKELFCENSQQNVSGNEEETRHRTGESVPVTVKEKRKSMREVNYRRHGLPNQGTNSRKNSDEANSEKQPHGISSSSSVFPNKGLVNEDLLQKKEREMEKKLNKYLIKKERHQLLLCFRRWFNLMFVRAMENSSLPRGGATMKEQKKVKHEEQKIPSNKSGASEDNHNSDSTPKNQPVEEPEKKSELPNPIRTTTMIKLRTKPFMETHVRRVSCPTESLSSESVREKESTTDVSWYIYPSSHKKSSSMEGGKRRGSQSSPLLDEKSVADILATLSPSLRSRVGMLFGGETPHSANFPKTSCVLSQLHSSAIPPQPSSWASLNVGNSYRNASGLSIPHADPIELEVLVDEEERKREKVEKKEEEEKRKIYQQLQQEQQQLLQQQQQQEQNQEQERQSSLASKNEAVGAKPLSATTIPQRSSPLAASSQEEVLQLHNRTDVTNEQVQLQASGAIEGILQSTNRVIPSLDRSPFSHERAEHPSSSQGDNVRGQDERIFINQRHQPHPPSPSPRRQGGEEYGRGRSLGLKSSMRGASAQPPMMERRKGEKRVQSILKNRNGDNHGSKFEKFRGVPGEYYIYHRGSYRNIRDPLSDIYCDAAGKRLPIYFVRHPASPAVSPTRSRWSLTRPRSPLGPNRLNPYCTVCVARYNLVLVDESMQPLTTTPRRLQHAEYDDTQTPHRSRTRSGRRLASGTNMPRHTTPHSPSEDFGLWNRIGKFPAHHCEHISPARRENASRRSNPQRGKPVLGTHQTVLKRRTPTPPSSQQRLNAELHESDHGLRNVFRNISPGEEKWLLRQERRLRRRMKSLLWHELPQSRGSRQWLDYLSSLKEVIEMLETLREGRSPDR